MIPPDSLLRLFVFIEVLGFEMINSFAVLDPLIKSFIQVVIIIGPLTIAGVVLLLKRIEKENPDRIRWK
tara:strand:- start:431 stop:637 length:207 start_codon:yes stop_codon:yes gene_type:complete